MVFLKGKHCSTTRGLGVWLGWALFFWGVFFANKSSLKHNIFYCIINQKSMLVQKK